MSRQSGRELGTRELWEEEGIPWGEEVKFAMQERRRFSSCCPW